MTNGIGQGYNNLAQAAPGVIGDTMLALGKGVNVSTLAVSKTVFTITGSLSQANQLALNTLNESQANLGNKVQQTSKETADNLQTTASVIPDSIGVILSVSEGFRHLLATALTSVRDSSGFALRMTGEGIGSLNKGLAKSQEETQKQIAKTHQNASNSIAQIGINAKDGTNMAIRSIQKPAVESKNFADRFVKSITIAAATFESYMFDSSPTKVTDVALLEVGKDYVVVTWKTNHYTRNNKVNYGTSLTYGEEAWGEDGTKEHKVKITGLKPGEKYYFEVMSQNKNYAYDAYYSFETKK